MDESNIIFILQVLKDNFNISPDAEITLEANPGTVTPKKIRTYINAGINRLSVGVQSFDADDLKFMTRIHTADEARNTIRLAKSEGFNNISLDLIFNLPGQTKAKWRYNLEQAVELPVTHISPYSLILEKGTILNKMVLDGKVEISDADYDAELYELTVDFLASQGFIQYEVSNFARPGFECLHNKFYWEYKDYLGFGTSAHSFVQGKRWWNFNSLTFYLNSVNEYSHAVAGSEILSTDVMLNEYVMLALRSSGLNLAELENKFGQVWHQKNSAILRELKLSGYLVDKGGKLSLTPKGYAVCDEILSRFN